MHGPCAGDDEYLNYYLRRLGGEYDVHEDAEDEGEHEDRAELAAVFRLEHLVHHAHRLAHPPRRVVDVLGERVEQPPLRLELLVDRLAHVAQPRDRRREHAVLRRQVRAAARAAVGPRGHARARAGWGWL